MSKAAKSALLRYFLLTAGACVMIYPLLWLLGATFRSNSEIFASAGILPLHPVTEGWQRAFTSYGGQISLLKALRNTYLIAVPKVLLTLLSIPLPSGYGYVNLGDGGVFLCAMLLPGGLGALAAGVGAALADLILGWAVYAPATFLIKGLTAMLAGLALRRAGKAALPLALLCCLLVPLGYFLYETVLLTAPAAAVNLLPNGVQAILGATLGTLVGRQLKKLIRKED